MVYRECKYRCYQARQFNCLNRLRVIHIVIKVDVNDLYTRDMEAVVCQTLLEQCRLNDHKYTGR